MRCALALPEIGRRERVATGCRSFIFKLDAINAAAE
jgi:hypothetical protein